MTGPDIFISYSRADRATARRFADCFAKEGFRVWWDAALHSGETFDEAIEKALKASKVVVVLWSPRSVTSRWVRAEATMADRRKKLAPVIVEACDLPLIFELTHTADLSHWDGDPSDPEWRAFVHDIHQYTERAKGNEAGAGEPQDAAPVSYSRMPAAAPRSPAGGEDRRAHQPAQARPKDLVYALSDLQAAIAHAQAAPTADHADLDERTQFYTQSDRFDLLDADEFHCLEIRDGSKLEKRYVVSPLGLKVGRTAPADVVLPDARVSRTHCLVELAGEALKVTDLNSTNGTYIDGVRISGSALLEVGSVLKVGNVRFTHEVRSRADV